MASLLVAVLLLGLVVMPAATQFLAPQAAFALGDPGPDTGTGTQESTASATVAPEAAPVTASPSATTSPSGTPSTSPTPSPSAKPSTSEPSVQTPSPSTAQATGTDDPRPTASAHPAANPTIASDQDDYAPGATVTLTGAGWQAGEVVRIVVNDTGGLSWSLTKDVTADDEGRVTLTFDLPDRYVPDYDVTATGQLSGTATTTFTDAATGAWQYWLTESDPPAGNVVAGDVITYTLNARSNDCWMWCNDVSGAVMTLTLTGSATFSGGSKTFTWSPDVLTRAGRSTTVTATVSSSAAVGGTIVARIAMGGTSTDGVRLVSSTQFETITHTVTAVVTRTCDFADTGSGAYASAICWFDLTGYDRAIAVNGQTMRQILPGGYTLTYTIRVGSTDAAAAAKEFPTWTGSYLGNPSSGVGGYQGISGMPAIYQSAAGTTTLALSNIRLTHSSDGSGPQVFGYALVGADAESTDANESITWKTSAPATFTSVGPLGNACSGGFTGAGTTTVTCTGGTNVGAKNGTAILYSRDPTTFSQTMVGSGLQGVGFGVMVSGVQLITKVVNPVKSTDGFTISVASGATQLGTKTANAASGWTADTGQIYWIVAGSIQDFTLTQSPTGSTNAANYAVSWACTDNGANYQPIGSSQTTKTVTLASFSDFIVCTITNTGPSLTLRKTTTGLAGVPFGFTLTNAAEPSGSVTTVTAGTPAQVDGGPAAGMQPFTLSAIGTDVKITEGAVAGWQLSSATCRSASGTTVGSLSGSVYTIPADSVVAGSAFTCDFINSPISPKVILRKTTTVLAGGAATFTLTNTTTQLSGTVTTSAPGTATPVGTFTASSFGTDVTITEGVQAGWVLASATCKNASSTVVGTLSGSSYTIPASEIVPGAVITCDYVNRPYTGTVTWSKVDAGNTSTLLAGSEWTLTGPGYPAPGASITDCAAAPCTGQDTDPVAGQFSVVVRYGDYSLAERIPPVGFQLDTTPHTFSITADGQVVAVGAITDKRWVAPSLPLTGGRSTDAFLLSGAALMAAAGIGALLHRRRQLRSS